MILDKYISITELICYPNSRF